MVEAGDVREEILVPRNAEHVGKSLVEDGAHRDLVGPVGNRPCGSPFPSFSSTSLRSHLGSVQAAHFYYHHAAGIHPSRIHPVLVIVVLDGLLCWLLGFGFLLCFIVLTTPGSVGSRLHMRSVLLRVSDC